MPLPAHGTRGQGAVPPISNPCPVLTEGNARDAKGFVAARLGDLGATESRRDPRMRGARVDAGTARPRARSRSRAGGTAARRIAVRRPSPSPRFSTRSATPAPNARRPGRRARNLTFCGLAVLDYPVGWFEADKWDTTDYRRGQVPKMTAPDVRAELEKQATPLPNGIVVRPVVIERRALS
jgi:hypothetical protein